MEPDPPPAPEPARRPPPAWRPGRPLALAGILLAAAGVAALLMLAAVGKVREAAARTASVNKLKQLGLGIQNFDAAQSGLPAHAMRDEGGRQTANWRYSILPYVNQDCYFNANTAAYDRHEPWDSGLNLAAIGKMDAEFAAPGVPRADGLSHYHAFDGENTPLAVAPRKAGEVWYRSKWSIAELTATHRGTSNLVFVVEAGPPAVWTHPDGLRYSPDAPLPAMEPFHLNGFQVLKGDGTVAFVRQGTPDAIWRAYIDPASTSGAVFE